MNILFTRFPLESARGGAEIQTISLMEGLIKRGHAVVFLGSCPVLLRMCKEKGIPAVKLHIGPPPVTKWGAISFLWRRKSMQRTLKEALATLPAPDAVFMLSLSEKLLLTPLLVAPKYKGDNHREAAGLAGPAAGAILLRERMDRAHSTHPAVAGLAQGTPSLSRGGRQTYGFPSTLVFWLEHDRVGPWLTKNPWLPRLRRLSKRVTTVTVSDLSRNIFVRLGWDAEKTASIPNGIDLNRFRSSASSSTESQAGIPTKSQAGTPALRVGTLSRLSPEKGIDLLIAAVQQLPYTSLTIIGTGKQEKYLRSLISQTNNRHKALSPKSFVLSPSVPNPATFYCSLDLFVLPSRDNDPFGLVSAEAMACGIPAIVTDACGIAGYLTDGKDAIVVKAGSADALREGIERLRDPAVRRKIGEEGKRTAERMFSVAKMVERYDALFS